MIIPHSSKTWGLESLDFTKQSYTSKSSIIEVEERVQVKAKHRIELRKKLNTLSNWKNPFPVKQQQFNCLAKTLL